MIQSAKKLLSKSINNEDVAEIPMTNLMNNIDNNNSI